MWQHFRWCLARFHNPCIELSVCQIPFEIVTQPTFLYDRYFWQLVVFCWCYWQFFIACDRNCGVFHSSLISVKTTIFVVYAFLLLIILYDATKFVQICLVHPGFVDFDAGQTNEKVSQQMRCTKSWIHREETPDQLDRNLWRNHLCKFWLWLVNVFLMVRGK